MGKQFKNQKNRVPNGNFMPMPTAVLKSGAMASLSANAKRLLLDLCGQFRFAHNGDLCAARSIMMAYGWKSHASLQQAIAELLKAGLIEQTRQGGRHRATLYAVTWLPVDHCDGKLDVPESSVASGLWKVPPVHSEKQIRKPITRASVARVSGQIGPHVGRLHSRIGPNCGPVEASRVQTVAHCAGTFKTLPCPDTRRDQMVQALSWLHKHSGHSSNDPGGPPPTGGEGQKTSAPPFNRTPIGFDIKCQESGGWS